MPSARAISATMSPVRTERFPPRLNGSTPTGAVAVQSIAAITPATMSSQYV